MRRFALLLMAALCACHPASDDPADSRSATNVPDLAVIEGSWRIVRIDGEPLPVSKPVPYLAFSADAAGGSVGCNAFGGTALYTEGRIAVHSWGGTAMACLGRVGDWEAVIGELFRAYPQVRVSGDTLSLRSRGHVVELTRMESETGQSRSPDPMRIPVANPPGQALADTDWVIRAIDGETASSSPDERHLRFASDTWQGLASCATLFGTYETGDGRLIVDDEITITEQNCPGDYIALDDAFADLMRSGPRYLVGPNGELIIAGGGHVLTGDRAR
ncbi:META domain-containing protein [Qipengyuania sp. MTN3-11]|uniref:META domain-containing protein n=1 Tax=Qipengyuania sp. MTN3-11 TaxID=3056557 RepID=UPI0036F39F25